MIFIVLKDFSDEINWASESQSILLASLEIVFEKKGPDTNNICDRT